MWKKKSRHGFPEERNVGEKFSVRPIGGGSSRFSVAVWEIRVFSSEIWVSGEWIGLMIGEFPATEGGPRRIVVEEAIETEENAMVMLSKVLTLKL
jgi:hypothetical protein